MAFLQHQPSRLNSKRQTDAIKSDEQIGRNSAHPDKHDNLGTSRIRSNAAKVAEEDWNIVFPGKPRNLPSGSNALQGRKTDRSPSDSPEEEVELDLTLPPAHDGTGNFTRPSSPSYHADDEHDRASLSPEVWGAPPSEAVTSELFTDDELDLLDEADVSSSALFSDSESFNVGRRSSNHPSSEENQPSTSISAHQLQRASRLNQHGSSTLASSSWSWMNAAQSQVQSARNVSKSNAHSQAVPAILTSESEGEEEEVRKANKIAVQARRKKDDAAFEEALGSAHQAYSAGLYPRVPKRRHRKNGESEKGSKRSNNSAAIASELLSANRRRSAVGRKSQTSAASLRSRSQVGSSVGRLRSKHEQSGKDAGTTYRPESSSRSERLLSAILQRVFGVDDEEVLQSFFRDEGPLRIEESEKERATNAAIASRAPIGNGIDDDVWSRNRRQHHMRLLLDGRSVAEEVEEIESGSEADAESNSARSKTRALSNSSHPHRTYVTGNVAEPSLPEALHATLLSGLRSVPSSLSLFLAGSNSVRFVNYLVGRIGPSFTERMRKLVDDASTEDGASQADHASQSSDIITRVLRSHSNAGSLSDLGSWDGVDVSSLRFKGDKHPAIASSSSRSTRSSSQSTVPATNM
ncbi:uncharacterized protein FA14DRAFT_159879 [Meira miltonrushii]|uniref:Uncharacterized protein n=1 Tax=Meira miltonrushii TaxID=1280837 RepID=A0A316VP56_9BASI|nr:uncharacterized protein FA14DRAFT_159879 [Meira miltonrushii]PWN38193.1 hypothetical protein FA14DRAFT_159879 [Meira miltonrushii]